MKSTSRVHPMKEKHARGGKRKGRKTKKRNEKKHVKDLNLSIGEIAMNSFRFIAQGWCE